jgi:hypothetical protein
MSGRRNRVDNMSEEQGVSLGYRGRQYACGGRGGVQGLAICLLEVGIGAAKEGRIEAGPVSGRRNKGSKNFLEQEHGSAICLGRGEGVRTGACSLFEVHLYLFPSKLIGTEIYVRAVHNSLHSIYNCHSYCHWVKFHHTDR